MDEKNTRGVVLGLILIILCAAHYSQAHNFTIGEYTSRLARRDLGFNFIVDRQRF
jgi:hypothetical protein